jgi:ribonuclease HI
MLEQEFTANYLAFINHLDNMPPILMKKYEAMNTALRQLFSRTGSLKKAVIFNDSTAAILSMAKSDVLSSKRITEEIHSSIKLLKGLQKDMKFKWISSHCGVVGTEIADYLAKKGTANSQTFARKL